MKRRVLLFLVTAILLCVGIAGSTVAWLFSKATVKNTFVLGDISISLNETTGNYYQLIPGANIAKDPKLTVYAGSEPCWLFVKIEEMGDLDKYISYDIADGWTKLEDGVYYREYTIRSNDVVYPILRDNAITVKDTVTEADESYLKKQGIFPSLSFKAYATQSIGFENAADAWEVTKNH